MNDWFRQLTLLNKIYKKNEKFSDTSSNFDFKMLNFYDKCRRARLFEHVYLQNVSIMLSNEALDYFYSNLQFCYSFHKFCVNIKHYFENLNDIVSISLDDKRFWSQISSQAIQFCLYSNVFEKCASRWALFKKIWILHLSIRFSYERILLESAKIISHWLTSWITHQSTSLI